MNKLKLFLENFIIYGLGSIIQKIVPLIMLPIVTRLMPDSAYFGISDMSHTVSSFMQALAIMGMYDAMYRMFFEKEDEEYKKDICSTALSFTLVTSAVIFVLMLIFKEPLSKFAFGTNEYSYLLYITAIATLVGATNSIVSAPTRMQNKRKIFLIMNTVSPILSYSVSIPLLLKGHYIIVLPLAGAIAGLTSEIIFWILNKNWFGIKRFKINYLKPLLMIGIPLLPNFLIYWVFNSSDKLMITNLIDVGATGVYSVGAKLGHVSQLIYTAFASGWQYFAFSTMKEDNQVKTNSLIFEYLGIISYICTMFIFVFAKVIYQLLFEGEYVAGYIISPYLFLAPLLQMLFQVEANQFLVVKKTWPNLFILGSGAIINVILNLKLIPVIGIEGAAIATLVGYAVSDIICTIVLIKMKLMVIDSKFVFASLIMLIYILIWRLGFYDKFFIPLIMTFIASGFIALLYRTDIIDFINMAKGFLKNKSNKGASISEK